MHINNGKKSSILKIYKDNLKFKLKRKMIVLFIDYLY